MLGDNHYWGYVKHVYECAHKMYTRAMLCHHRSLECSILCVKSLHKILRYHAMYKDVFREVGLLEVMVTCLHRYAALLKEPHEEGTG